MICSLCFNECNCKLVNHGIGWNEYWGHRAHDEKLIVVSDCCEEVCLDEHNHEITPKDLENYYEEKHI